MTHATFTPAVDAFRFYDNGSESGSTPKAAQDTNVTITVDTNQQVHLRYRMQETGGASGATTDDYRLEFSKNGGAFQAVSGTVEVQPDTTSSLLDGVATTNRGTNGISDGTGLFLPGEQEEGNGLIEDYLLTASNFTEHVWAILLVATGLADGDTIDFRVTLNGGTPGMTNSVTPRITVQKLAQSITGVGNIASGEAFGGDKLNFSLSGFGAIASLEAFGAATVAEGAAGQSITDAGAIASLETFGTGQLNLTLSGAGAIASLEAFGTAQLDFLLSALGDIASIEAFGDGTVSQAPPDPQSITDLGAITSLEEFGNVAISLSVGDLGDIASVETFGNTALGLTLVGVGAIATDETFGGTEVFIVGGGQVITDAGDIQSAEAFGTDQVNFTITGVGGIGGSGGGTRGLIIFGDD